MNALILSCSSCKTPTNPYATDFQNKEYGKQMRVHNPCKKSDEYRCTICGNKRKP